MFPGPPAVGSPGTLLEMHLLNQKLGVLNYDALVLHMHFSNLPCLTPALGELCFNIPSR